jgi:hypothetical protein
VSDTYLPFAKELGETVEKVPSRVFVEWIFTKEGHVFEIEAKLLCLPSRILHYPLSYDADSVLWMEFLGVAEIAGIEAGLNVINVANVVLRVLNQ